MGLVIPIRGQLSALVFSKTMRKKDVKGVQKGKDPGNEDIKDSTDPKTAAGYGGDNEDELKNMKQGTINLLAIDSSRISEFTAYSSIFGEALSGMIFGLSLLIKIIGSVSLWIMQLKGMKLMQECYIVGKALLLVLW